MTLPGIAGRPVCRGPGCPGETARVSPPGGHGPTVLLHCSNGVIAEVRRSRSRVFVQCTKKSMPMPAGTRRPGRPARPASRLRPFVRRPNNPFKKPLFPDCQIPGHARRRHVWFVTAELGDSSACLPPAASPSPPVRRSSAAFRATLPLAAICLAIALAAAPAQAQIGSDRYSSIVIDAADGNVLSAVNADELRHPASLTKMMTLYMVFEALRDRRITPAPARAGLRPRRRDGARPSSACCPARGSPSNRRSSAWSPNRPTTPPPRSANCSAATRTGSPR